MTYDDNRLPGRDGRNDPLHEERRNRRAGFGPGMVDGEPLRGRRGFGPGGVGFDPEMIAQLRRGFRHGGPGFEGFGPGRQRRQKGDIRIAIIAVLDDAEAPSRNGYAIMKAIGEATGGVWQPSPGSVYPTLQQLVDEGLVTATGDGRSTEYSLTDEGRAFAAEHAELLGSWAKTEAPSDATRALFESAGKLMAALGQFRHTATDEQKVAATAQLDAARKAIYLILAE